MDISHMLVDGFIYAFIGNGYLFLAMIFLNPRIWGYADYPDVVKSKVPPQTSKEKFIAFLMFIPWILLLIIYPLYSTFLLKANLGNEFSYLIAFLNIAVLFFLFFLGDLIILDWLIINKITPTFVIIPGTDVSDYKDFSHHYKGHLKAILPFLILCFILAGIVVLI